MIDALLQGRLSGLQLLEQLRQAGFDLPVIVITVPQRPVKVDPAWGIVRVLSMPFSGYDLINAIQAAQHEAAANRPEATSRTLVVHGAKGGVGKTTLAFNLAVAIAHAKGMRTIVVDGNLQFGDIRALLRVPDQAPSVLQLPTDRVSETDLEQVVWRDPSGIDILLAPPRMEMAEMVTVRDMDKTLSLLKRVYNVVIIDTPTLVNDHGAVVVRCRRCHHRADHRRLDDAAQHAPHGPDVLGHSATPLTGSATSSTGPGAPGSIDPRLIAEQLGRRPGLHAAERWSSRGGGQQPGHPVRARRPARPGERGRGAHGRSRSWPRMRRSPARRPGDAARRLGLPSRRHRVAA